MEENIEELFKEVILLQFQRNYLKLKAIGLYPGQELILKYLIQHEGVMQSELVSFTKKRASTITKMVQRMQEKGFLIRLEEPQDKRIYRLYATQKGKETYTKIVALKQEVEAEYATLFSDKERDYIYEFLIRIRNHWKGENNEKNR